jgi:hypothetical protein
MIGGIPARPPVVALRDRVVQPAAYVGKALHAAYDQALSAPPSPAIDAWLAKLG